MSSPVNAEAISIGTDVEPELEQAVGSRLWVIKTGIREIVATRQDPLKVRARRDLVKGFEILKELDINSDYITDCFTYFNSATLPQVQRHGGPSSFEVGSVRWAVDTAIRELVAANQCPKRAKEGRQLIRGYEMMGEGVDIADDDITDFFTDATTSVDSKENVGIANSGHLLSGVSALSQGPHPSALGSLSLRGPRSRRPCETIAENHTASYQSTTARAQEEEFTIMLCPENRDPREILASDIVAAQWSNGSGNLILRSVALRQKLKMSDPQTAEAWIGIYASEDAYSFRSLVRFTVKSDEDTKMGDVLLGSELRNRWEDFNECQMPVFRPGRPPNQCRNGSTHSSSSRSSHHGHQNQPHGRVELAFRVLDTMDKILHPTDNGKGTNDSGYSGSEELSSGSLRGRRD